MSASKTMAPSAYLIPLRLHGVGTVPQRRPSPKTSGKLRDSTEKNAPSIVANHTRGVLPRPGKLGIGVDLVKVTVPFSPRASSRCERDRRNAAGTHAPECPRHSGHPWAQS